MTNYSQVHTNMYNAHIPGSGACLAPLVKASGRIPINLGKPETFALDLLIKEYIANEPLLLTLL